MIVGEFNYHFDSSSPPHSSFKQLTHSLGLNQHILIPSHISGNIIDLIFTPNDTPTFISSCSRSDLLTDHYLFHTSILLKRPSPTKSLMHYRNLKNLDYTDLCSRVSHFLWNTNIYFDNLNLCLSFSLNALSPIKYRYFTLHISSPWFTSHLATVKRSLRKLERKIHISPSHKYKFLIARKAYKLELNLHKTSYYESKFNACGNDTRQFFKMANSILGTNIKSKSTALPDAVLCSSFVSSLPTKLSRIFDNISSKLAQLPMTLYAPITTNPISCKLSCFTPPSIIEIRNLILTANSTSPIDPLPLVVFKNIVPITENAILYLISQSLDDGIMVSSLKYSIIKPILKKSYLIQMH